VAEQETKAGEQTRSSLQVPAWFLFGEARQAPVYGFFHAEPYAIRSVPHEWNIPHHLHPDFDQMSVLISGASNFELDGIQQVVGSPSVVFMKAGVVHRFSYTPGAEGYVLSFSPDFAQSLSQHTSSTTAILAKLAAGHPARNIEQQTTTTLRRHCDYLCYHTKRFHPHRQELLSHTFAALLLELATFVSIPNQAPGATSLRSPYAELLERYHALLHAQVGQLGFTDAGNSKIPTTQAMATELGCTPQLLNRACKEVAGQGAREVLQASLAMQASRLLLFTELSVKEVSYALGYSHPSHFLRFFKRHRHATPEEFRRTNGAGAKPFD